MIRRALVLPFVFALALVAALAASGCGSGGSANGDDDGGAVTVDATVTVDAPPGSTTVRLVSSTYSLNAGEEFYQCQRLTLPDAVNVLKITPVSPTGVHHEVFAIDDSHTMPDGVTRCGPLGTRWRTLFASGVNSPSLTMPSGVALKVPAGAQIVLGLHLFNTSSATLTGTASLDVITVPDAAGLVEAGVPFAGSIGFTVPVNPPRDVNGTCTIDRATKFFAVFPHMHQTGSHMKVWVETAAGQQVVWDEDYDFNDQRFGMFPAVDLVAGDKIKMTCSYSAAGAGKSFGDSTTAEMCFAISYVYPPIASTGSLCAN
jgi:Copper type II ascorbate-dependent monooxygenase, C-terminal domain